MLITRTKNKINTFIAYKIDQNLINYHRTTQFKSSGSTRYRIFARDYPNRPRESHGQKVIITTEIIRITKKGKVERYNSMMERSKR
jgi:hypothetical protein